MFVLVVNLVLQLSNLVVEGVAVGTTNLVHVGETLEVSLGGTEVVEVTDSEVAIQVGVLTVVAGEHVADTGVVVDVSLGEEGAVLADAIAVAKTQLSGQREVRLTGFQHIGSVVTFVTEATHSQHVDRTATSGVVAHDGIVDGELNTHDDSNKVIKMLLFLLVVEDGVSQARELESQTVVPNVVELFLNDEIETGAGTAAPFATVTTLVHIVNTSTNGPVAPESVVRILLLLSVSRAADSNKAQQQPKSKNFFNHFLIKLSGYLIQNERA